MTHLPQNPDVIVVGAGTAGLSAAQTLRRSGLDVVVLEAADHVGGRCVTDATQFPVAFDRGGSWLHAAAINPLARIAEDQQVQLHKTEWEFTYLFHKGRWQTDEDVADYAAYHEAMWPVIERRGAQDPDTTVLDAMPAGAWKATAAHWVPQMLGGDADVTSAKDTYLYAEAEGDWLVAGGLGRFVHDLHSDVPVVLSCPVSAIDYSGTRVSVTTPLGTLEADHIVLTVSVGVLAAETIAFTPALPDRKRDAVNALPNGLLNKVGLLFEPGWNGATEGKALDYCSSDTEFCSVAFGFYGTSLATGFVAGRFADALEREGPGSATDYCLEALRAKFGKDIEKSIQSTSETAWRGNPFTFGSYSYSTPGGVWAREALAETVDDRLFFAGEATMVESYSTVHGAYLSGKAAAQRVMSLSAR